LENTVRRLETLARRHRRGDNVSAAAVRESHCLLSSRMILAGKQNRAQSGVAPSAPTSTSACGYAGGSAGGNALSGRVCVCLGMLLLSSPHLSLYPLHANTLLQAGTPTPVWSSLAQEDDSPFDDSGRIEKPPPHHSCRGCGAGRYVKSFHLFGWRVCLALPDSHLHVVHGVSTPYEEAKNSLFCTEFYSL
jgi:hypothetical protein